MFHFDTCGCSKAETKFRSCKWKWNESVENAAHVKPRCIHLLRYSLVWSAAFIFISALLAQPFSLSLTRTRKQQPELRSRGGSKSMGRG